MSEYAKLISEYGILIVIGALMIMIFVMLFKSFLNRFETMMKQDNERFDKLFDLVTGTHSEEEDEYINKVYDNTYSILDKLREDTDMDRSYVFMFHNGGRSLAGMPFYKMSCISESVSVGVEHMSYQSQNLLLSAFPQMTKELHKSRKIHIVDTGEYRDSDISFYSFMSSRGSKSCFIRAIVNNDDRILGMIGVESLHLIDNQEIINNIDKILEDSADKLLMTLLIYPKEKFLPKKS